MKNLIICTLCLFFVGCTTLSHTEKGFVTPGGQTNSVGTYLTGILNANGYTITNLAAPASASTAATKAYVDAIASTNSALFIALTNSLKEVGIY
jgi:hypothetical protein